MASHYHVRSASYPPKSNNVILKVEKQLKKIRESEASSTSPLQIINISFIGLSGLYKCVDEALAYLPHTHVDHLVSGSSNLLDICNASREMLVKLREAVGDLRLSDEKLLEVSRYFSTRKEIVRSARELVLRLRQVEVELMLRNEENEPEIIRMFRCISIINISVMESFLKIVLPNLPRSCRFSKMWGGKSKAEESSGGYELSDIDVALHDMSSKKRDIRERMVNAHKRLEGLEEGLRGIENGLSCIFSQLAKTRASLLKHSFLQ